MAALHIDMAVRHNGDHQWAAGTHRSQYKGSVARYIRELAYQLYVAIIAIIYTLNPM